MRERPRAEGTGMDRSIMWERVGAASGIAFVALLLASFLVIPDAPPALDDPIADIRSFFVDNSSNVQASAYLTGLAGFVFLGFLGSLGGALRTVGRDRVATLVVFPAAALALALAFVNAAVLDSLATRVAAESDQAVRLPAAWMISMMVLVFRNWCGYTSWQTPLTRRIGSCFGSILLASEAPPPSSLLMSLSRFSRRRTSRLTSALLSRRSAWVQRAHS